MKAFQIQVKYWKSRLQSFPESQQITASLKTKLQRIRNRHRQHVKLIDIIFGHLNCEPDKLDCAQNKNLYSQILEEIPMLSVSVNCDMINFTKLIAQKALDIHRLPERKFSIVAMGSMARGEATPYSDLEFLILIEHRSDEIVEYFQNLAITIYFIIGNLRETKLKYMAIPELMTWDESKGKNSSWFDDVAMNGFKIDGLGQMAGNIPTGNGSAQQQNHFICTVDELTERYKAILDAPHPDISIRGDLTAMLATTVCIFGDYRLYEDFRAKINSYQPNDLRKNATNRMLANDASNFDFKLDADLTHTRHLKTDVYRYPSILLLNLRILHGIHSCDLTYIVTLLQSKGIISASVGNCLKFSLCCALYIRLSAYLYHDSQNESISILSSNADDNLYTGACYIPPELLIHMFIHLQPLKASVMQMASDFASGDMIDVEITKRSKHEMVALIRYFCGDFYNVLSLLRAEYPDGLEVAETSIQYNYIYSAIECKEYEEAERLLAQRIQSKNYGEFDYYLLVRLYEDESRLIQAQDCYETRLAMLFSLHGQSDHELVAQSMDSVGTILQLQGFQNEALDEYQKSLSMRQRLFPGADHVDIAVVLNNIGSVRDNLGQYDKALIEYRRCLDILVKIYGDRDHEDIATVLNNIGYVYMSQGLYNDAIAECKKCYEMRRRIHKGRDHVDVAGVLNNIAAILRMQGRYSEALAEYKICLTMMERIFGARDHVDIATILSNIGVVLWSQGLHTEASIEYKKCLAMRQRIFGDQCHTDTANIHYNIGNILNSQGRYGDALEHYQKSLAMMTKIFSNRDHADIANVINDIGTVLESQGKYDDAFAEYQKCLLMLTRLYGDEGDHPDMERVRRNIRRYWALRSS